MLSVGAVTGEKGPVSGRGSPHKRADVGASHLLGTRAGFQHEAVGVAELEHCLHRLYLLVSGEREPALDFGVGALELQGLHPVVLHLQFLEDLLELVERGKGLLASLGQLHFGPLTLLEGRTMPAARAFFAFSWAVHARCHELLQRRFFPFSQIETLRPFRRRPANLRLIVFPRSAISSVYFFML